MDQDTIQDGPAPFMLTAAEKQSGLWIRLENHLKDRLADMRGQNDGDLDPVQTARLRGRISFAKSLLELSRDPLDPSDHE